MLIRSRGLLFAPLCARVGNSSMNDKRRNPVFLLVGAAAIGALVARMIDWRSHAHPR